MLLAATVLVTGLLSCQQKIEEPMKVVDLRYRAEDSYDLAARGAKAFTILVASTDPWTVTSEHPDWCIISEEEGDASDPELVHTGKAEATTIRVQYYDNLDLDGRDDKITIKSDYWIGKVISIHQAGIAYLTIPEAELEQDVVKAGGEYAIHISSNQNWSARVTDGDWISITEGASGNGDGTVTVLAADNTTELRYAKVTVYDRHGETAATVHFTQDGVQLEPVTEELRAGYDQASGEFEVKSNTRWTATKSSEADTWFEILTPEGNGDGTVRISFTQNDDRYIRSGEVVLQSVASEEGAFVARKVVTVKQAYRIQPKRVLLNAEEYSLWSPGTDTWVNKPEVIKDLGIKFTAKGRMSRSMVFGTYTFHWSNMTDNAVIRHWMVFDKDTEIKTFIYPLYATEGEHAGQSKVSFEFNAPEGGGSEKPSLNSYYCDAFSEVDMTIKFDPSGEGFCHITFLVNGTEAASFDSSDKILHTITWGSSSTIYVGVDEAGSAVCEWYEYTEPMNWED